MSRLFLSRNIEDGNGRAGICAEQPHTGVTTNSWALFNDVVPADGIAAAWQQAADFGLEGFGAASVAPCNPVVFDWDFPMRRLFLSRNIEGATDAGRRLRRLHLDRRAEHTRG